MSKAVTDAHAHRLAAIVEFSDDAIVSMDLNGVICTWNRAAERIFGYTAANAIGRRITLIIPPDRLSEEDEVISRIRRAETVDQYETIRRHKDGSLVPISVTVSPIRDGRGTVIGASKIARDIGDRRRADAALAAAQARQLDLQQRLVALVAASGTLFGSPKLADMMPAVVVLARTLIPADGYAVWRHDLATGAWHVGASSGVSDRFSQRIIDLYHGTRVADVPFTDPLVAEQVEKVPMLDEQLEAYRAEGIVSMLAVPLTIGGRGSGTLVFYYRSRHAFSEVEVHTARALGTMSAAAIAAAEMYEDQRRTREQAERSNRQSTLLAEMSAALASSLDYEATLRTVANLAVPHIADWCAVDVIDEQGATRRLAVAHVDSAKVDVARTFRERYPDNAESPGAITHVLRTGKPVMISKVTDAMLVQIARNEDHLRAMRELEIRSYLCVPMAVLGRTLGAITFVTAESDRHYTPADFRFAQDVASRAAFAVENARAYRQANAANRAKDEFLATLSHELRTPLNAVLGWTRMLRNGSLSGQKMTRAFEVIERNAVAQLDLVEDLLDLSRIITGKFRLDVRPVRLSAAIDAAVEAVQPAATAKGIAIDVLTDSRTDLVLGDAARLQQVVWNLLANAIKFTPRGGSVRVSVERPDEHVGQVDVAVADTGEGIEAAVLPYVFDRFRQGDGGTTRTHTGLGLGLAIVRHIVELHGGTVAVMSPGKGQGATFRISLPATSAVAPAEAPVGREPTMPGQSARVPLIEGLRALVVEDDQDARDLLSELLRGRGVRVTAAASGADALEVLDREIPDVIVSDIAMPGLDGFELIERVRKRPPERGGRVPAVALTAYARPEDRERSLLAGFQAHLSKPVDLEELLSTVANLAGPAERT
jgi:PAS domain S-box-containing protein